MKQKAKIKNFLRPNNGFTLLLSLLIVSVLLSISLGISEIVLKETVISGFGRDSLKAFFAADSGVECVLYWDIKQNAFATTSTSSTITCAGSTATFNPSSGHSSFTVNFSNGAFSQVEVDKITNYPLTAITAYGRSSGTLTDTRRVERGLKVTY